jgi:hypothetical protein
MLKIVVLAGIAALCAITLDTSAQDLGSDYKTSVGVKFGWWEGGSLSVKHFVKENVAVEALLSFWQYGGEACGLYEFHGKIPNVDGLKWYVGGGGHVGVYNTDWAKNYPDRPGQVYLGPDGVLGIDYKFTGAPIDLSFAVHPRFDIPGGYFNVWGGLGVRFAF